MLLEIALWSSLRNVLLQAAEEGETQGKRGMTVEGQRRYQRQGEKKHLMWKGIIAETERLVDTQRTAGSLVELLFARGKLMGKSSGYV